MQLPGIILAALATLVFGAVLGPEMPLIAVGGGLAVLVTRLSRRPVPNQAAKLPDRRRFRGRQHATWPGGPTLGLMLARARRPRGSAR